MTDVLATFAAVAGIFAPILIWMQRRITKLEGDLGRMHERLLGCEKARAAFEARLSPAE
mgnify:CR=1 FL=1